MTEGLGGFVASARSDKVIRISPGTPLAEALEGLSGHLDPSTIDSLRNGSAIAKAKNRWPLVQKYPEVAEDAMRLVLKSETVGVTLEHVIDGGDRKVCEILLDRAEDALRKMVSTGWDG